MTPEDRHTGREHAILAARVRGYDEAQATHPARWRGATRNWTPVTIVRLNPTTDDLLAQAHTAA